MKIREYIIDGKNVKKLSDFVVIFAGFSSLNEKGTSSVVSDSDIDIAIRKRLGDDDNLDRLDSYIYDIVNPLDKHIGENDYVVIKIINSNNLIKVLGYESAFHKYDKILKEYVKNYPDDNDGIKRLEFILSIKKEKIPYNSMLDELLLMILKTKKIRLVMF